LAGAVECVVLLGAPPVVTAALEASDVVWAPVDVEDLDGEFVEAAVGELGESPGLTAVLEGSDVACAPVGVEDPDRESVDAAVRELDAVPDEESDGSARASPCPESAATPTPSVIIRPANRPMSRTAFLTRISGTVTTSAAKENEQRRPEKMRCR
jgi:hypothetical protein